MKKKLTALLLSSALTLSMGIQAVAAPISVSEGFLGIDYGYYQPTALEDEEDQDLIRISEGSQDATSSKNLNIKLSDTSYTYDGKAKKPTVTVTTKANKKLKEKTDYTVTYPSGRKNIGTYTITIKFKKSYTGTEKVSFKINPPKATIKVSAKNIATNAATVTLNGTKKNYDGYQIEIKPEGGKSSKLTAKATATGLKINKLISGTSYQARVRTYKKVGKTTYYSSWSSIIKFTTKGTKPATDPVPVAPIYTDEELTALILSYQAKEGFTEGSPWNDDDNVYNTKMLRDGESTYLEAHGCVAFTMTITDEIFGKGTPIRTEKDYTKVRVGDIVRTNNDTHEALVYEVNGTKVKVCEGNISINGGIKMVHWGREIDLADPKYGFTYILTRR